MNESVTGGIRFNANVCGYVLSTATTIIYKQWAKILAVECLEFGTSNFIPEFFGITGTAEGSQLFCFEVNYLLRNVDTNSDNFKIFA